MLRRIWNMLKRLVESLFAPAPDPRKGESPAHRRPTRQRQEDLLARIRNARERVQMVRARLERRVTSLRRDVPDLLDEARKFVEIEIEDAARVVLHRRQAALREIRLLEERLASVTTEEQTLASVEDRLVSEMVVWSVHQEDAAARFDSAVARATLTEALTGVSDEFSGIEDELRLAHERAENMEARVTALNELLGTGVLSSHTPPPILPAASDSSSIAVEALLDRIKAEATSGGDTPVDACRQYIYRLTQYDSNRKTLDRGPTFDTSALSL